MREKVLGRQWQYPLFCQFVGIWESHHKTLAKSLGDRGSIGYFLDIDVWQSGTTRIMQDGIMVKGLGPMLLNPCKYHINPRTDLEKLEKGLLWRTIKDQFGKFKWIDHEGRVHQGIPYAVEPDAAAKTLFIASMMHAQMHSPEPQDEPDVMCPSDVQDSERRNEVVHHEEIPGHSKSKKKNLSDKKSNFTIAKSIPVTPKAVAASTGSMREKWLLSIYKERERDNFLQNMAITDADPALVIKWKSLGKWPLPCQVVFVLKPLPQTQQTADDADQDYKQKH